MFLPDRHICNRLEPNICWLVLSTPPLGVDSTLYLDINPVCPDILDLLPQDFLADSFHASLHQDFVIHFPSCKICNNINH
jgi:hypothetical protein